MPPSIPTLQPTEAHLLAFRNDLNAWYRRVAREMPWRSSTDPYRIWISEIMLQQTRVDQARPYYDRFVERFPDVTALAGASIDEVLKAWEGMGYYARARHLHDAAGRIVSDHGGRLPDTYHGLLGLPGVGPYTAAAVSSIAFGRARAVLDGNVARVLARVFAFDAEIDRSAARRELQRVADLLLDPDIPGTQNQATMELGATVCTPRSPACGACPIASVCTARAEGNQDIFPVTKKKKPTPHFDIAVGLIYNAQGEILIQRRAQRGLLGGLWEFPGGKRKEGESLEATCEREVFEEVGLRVAAEALVDRVDHAYSHFRITMYAFRCRILEGKAVARVGQPLVWATVDELESFAFPRANRKMIDTLINRRHQPTLFE